MKIEEIKALSKQMADMSDMVGDHHWQAHKAIEELLQKRAAPVALGALDPQQRLDVARTQPSAPAERGVVLPPRAKTLTGSEWDTQLAEAYNDALDEVARLNPAPATAAQPWIPVSERLPEIGQECLIRIPVCGSHNIEGAKYVGEGDFHGAWCVTHGSSRAYKVSHWMPRPAAPATADSDVREVSE